MEAKHQGIVIAKSTYCVCSQSLQLLQVAVMPNTLAFNHALSALETAASIGRDQAFASLLADHAVRLFHSMQNRAGSPPDANTYDLVIAVLSKVGADSQALHRYQLKLQQVRYGPLTVCTRSPCRMTHIQPACMYPVQLVITYTCQHGTALCTSQSTQSCHVW